MAALEPDEPIVLHRLVLEHPEGGSRDGPILDSGSRLPYLVSVPGGRPVDGQLAQRDASSRSSGMG